MAREQLKVYQGQNREYYTETVSNIQGEIARLHAAEQIRDVLNRLVHCQRQLKPDPEIAAEMKRAFDETQDAKAHARELINELIALNRSPIAQLNQISVLNYLECEARSAIVDVERNEKAYEQLTQEFEFLIARAKSYHGVTEIAYKRKLDDIKAALETIEAKVDEIIARMPSEE